MSQSTARSSRKLFDKNNNGTTGRTLRGQLSNLIEQLEPRMLMSAGPALSAPTYLTAAVQGVSSVQLHWTDTTNSAAGYEVLRSTDGVHYTQLSRITGSAATGYNDTSVSPGHTYDYRVQAYALNSTSSVSNTAVATPTVSASLHLSTVSDTSSSIQLHWTGNNPTATGYYLLRITDGVHIATVATIPSSTASSYTDTSVVSGHQYQYEVEAYTGHTVSATSNVDIVVTPLVAPSGLSATAQSASINLQWTDHDSAATGYLVLRSTNGTSFTQLANLASGSAHTYTDSAITTGQTYYYEVVACNSVSVSPASTAAHANVPTPSPTPAPTPSPTSNGSISISTRYGDELVIMASGASGTSNTILVVQSGSTLTITADGQIYTDATPAAGLFIYTRGDTNAISIAASVTVFTTIDTIEGALAAVTCAGTNVEAWINTTDVYTGTGVMHRIASFADGVSKAVGASMPNPTDGGATTVVNLSLWGTGPTAADVNQGEVGDCYFLSSLAGFANNHPSTLVQSAVDMGDGTYAVQFFNGSTPEYIRVSDAFSSGPFNGLMYAHPGSAGTIWAAVLEKAFAYFRTGANTFASINSGWMSEVYSDLGVGSSSFALSSYSSDASLYNTLSSELASGKPVTFGTSNNTSLVAGHAYTLISVSMVNGVAHYVVRNPWGVSGDSLENSQGYATLTYAQMEADFSEGCMAT